MFLDVDPMMKYRDKCKILMLDLNHRNNFIDEDWEKIKITDS